MNWLALLIGVGIGVLIRIYIEITKIKEILEDILEEIE